jgi:hypothetical protein
VIRRLLFILLALFVLPGAALSPQGQDAPGGTAWEVLLLDAPAGSEDTLVFTDIRTLESSVIQVDGERYTALADGVLLFDNTTRLVRLALPDGQLIRHPLVRMDADAARIDWLVSMDGMRLAWTQTYRTPAGALTTITHVADRDGGGYRVLYEDPGRTDGLRATPVAFVQDNARLIMDMQPDGLDAFSPFHQYAGLLSVDLATGEADFLPQEPGCYCGAGFAPDTYLRLMVSPEQSGYFVDVRDYISEDPLATLAPVPEITPSIGGEVLMDADHAQAAYVLTTVTGLGAVESRIVSTIVRVDLARSTQTVAADGLDGFVHLLRWSDDGASLEFTTAAREETWILDTATGETRPLLRGVRLGTIRPLR